VISIYQLIVTTRNVARAKMEQAKIKTGWRYHLDGFKICMF